MTEEYLVKPRIALLIATAAVGIGVLAPLAPASAIPIYSIGPYATQESCTEGRNWAREAADPWYLTHCNQRSDGWYFMMSGY